MNDEYLYLEATKEVESGMTKPALWAKVITLSEGDEEKAKYQYVKLRVAQLADERKSVKPTFSNKPVDEFDLKYMPIAEFSKIKSIPEKKVIEMIKGGFYIGQIKNDTWHVSRDEVKKEDRAFSSTKTARKMQKSIDIQYIPVDEFAEHEGITTEKAIKMIRDGFYQGRVIEDNWHVASSEFNNKKAEKQYVFQNLGIWRKIYLILNWLGLIIASVMLLDSEKIAPELLFLVFLGWPFLIWLHAAVVGRKVIQLRWLAGLSLIPLMNPVGAIVIWLISSISKEEAEKKPCLNNTKYA